MRRTGYSRTSYSSVGFAEHFDQGILQSQRDADADADAPQNPHFLRLATIQV